MTGYWKQPELTARALTDDGWLRTGDVGCLDDDGRLYLVDRVKDVIIVVGGHVHPAEVEDLLHTHPAVAHCAVYGVRTADEAEQVHAAVVPAPGRRVDTAALRAFVTEHKGALYAPVDIRVVDEIPSPPSASPTRPSCGPPSPRPEPARPGGPDAPLARGPKSPLARGFCQWGPVEWEPVSEGFFHAPGGRRWPLPHS
ncbi:class I adenylate-forming enzyme family protein [Streptomyces sirii]|uniref:class I adenylate-forming enzyme family protein n=1 Tax=Streptomyces sirii TaxID=3127701 RepID=UPI003D36D775